MEKSAILLQARGMPADQPDSSMLYPTEKYFLLCQEFFGKRSVARAVHIPDRSTRFVHRVVAPYHRDPWRSCGINFPIDVRAGPPRSTASSGQSCSPGSCAACLSATPSARPDRPPIRPRIRPPLRAPAKKKPAIASSMSLATGSAVSSCRSDRTDQRRHCALGASGPDLDRR